MEDNDKKSSPTREILKSLKKRKKPKKIGWGPVSAIIVTLGIYLGAQLIAGYFIIQYLISTGSRSEDIGSLVEGSVPLQFSFILLVEIVSILLLWWFLRHRKISWPNIGLKRPSGKNLLYAIPGYGIYFAIILMAFVFIENLVPSINVKQEQQVGFESASGAGPLLLVFVALVILPALVEEILVRGFLYGGLRNKLKPVASALIASAVFGVAHLQFGSGKDLLWIAAIDTFILSMVLIWLREKTGNLWAGVVVHMMKNSLAFLSLFVFKVL